jgi:hypothetical protein
MLQEVDKFASDIKNELETDYSNNSDKIFAILDTFIKEKEKYIQLGGKENCITKKA